MSKRLSSWAAGIIALCFIASPLARAVDLKTYESKYYVIHSDLEPDQVREASLRMTRMAEEYYNRTRDFSGSIRQKFPFFLFAHESDYLAAGGLPGSAGVYMGSSDGTGKLMAIAGQTTDRNTWHVVQHEGFHQFAHAVIGGELPVWANEGLAEYFGESIFTGDGFVTGVVPPDRLVRIKEEIDGKKLKTIQAMMLLSPEQWSAELSIENYDQAWSMVYFLVHADQGKYQRAFVAFMQHVARGQQWDKAWLETLGPAGDFEPRWKDYWSKLPEHPTSLLYAQAETATLTSFLARAVAQKQSFKDFDEFKQAASDQKVKLTGEEWLPQAMLESALRQVDESGSFTLAPSPQTHAAQLIDTMSDGSKLVGSFVVRSGHVTAVNVEVDGLPPIIAHAKELADSGEKPKARLALTDGIKAFPKSAEVPEARKLLATLR